MTDTPLSDRMREEWEALRLLSYHGTPFGFAADLIEEDVAKIRALLREAGRIIEAAERFAFHDPGIDWPSPRHDDAVDAICAAFDRVREELAEELDRV